MKKTRTARCNAVVFQRDEPSSTQNRSVVLQADMAEGKDPTTTTTDSKDEKMSIDEWGVKGGGCTIMTLRLLATAIKDNEASCRDVFKYGAKDNKIFTQLIVRTPFRYPEHLRCSEMTSFFD